MAQIMVIKGGAAFKIPGQHLDGLFPIRPSNLQKHLCSTASLAAITGFLAGYQ
jgi:hypothetical protein